MNPARFESFALAYAPAIRQAAVRSGVHLLAGETAEDYALRVTMTLLDRIEAKGVESVRNYYLNSYGGALKSVATELGIAPTVKAIQDYLDGR